MDKQKIPPSPGPGVKDFLKIFLKDFLKLFLLVGYFIGIFYSVENQNWSDAFLIAAFFFIVHIMPKYLDKINKS